MKNKKLNYISEEQKEVKKFIIVLIGLIILIVGIYFFTKAFITKDLFKDNEEIKYTDGVINYDIAIVGNMLNRPFDEYYLIAFDSENNKATYYNALISKYMSKEKKLKIYHIDLNNELNKKYITTDNNVSKNFENIEKLKLGEVTLIKVENKKVTNFITNIDEISKELTK